jgi:hypothetical protein
VENGDRPATKKDLQELEQRMDTRILEVEQRMGTRMEQMEHRLQEFGRDIQTEMLRGFERYAQGMEIRTRKLEADLGNLNASESARLANVEFRVLEIEKKLLMGGK